MKYEQMSIYDFLPEEKSQEVQPSESVPQVDEAQVVLNSFDEDGDYKKYPSSDLDTRASNTLDLETYETIVEECEEAFQPTEDTDSTLFSVGECARVVNPYHYGHEDWDYLEDFRGKVVKLSKLMRVSEGVQTFKCYFLHEIARRDNYFNSNELQKI